MRKWTGRLFGTLVVLVLAGCGSGGGGSSPSIRDQLIGTWKLIQRSTDGGATFQDVTTVFTFTLQSNGLWTDSEADAGTWSLSGDRFTTTHADSSVPKEYSLVGIELQGQQARFRYTNESFTPNNKVSVYQKQE